MQFVRPTWCQHKHLPSFHICLDITDPEFHRVHEVKRPKRILSQAHKEAIAEAQRERHAQRRALTSERDTLIIKHYVEGGMGMSHISSTMGVAQSTVNKVLHQAQREGVLKIRPKNFTLARPAH